MGAGECAPADPSVEGHPERCLSLDDRGALHVAQLAPVVERSSCTPLVQPRKMSGVACIIRWPSTTRWPGVLKRVFGRWLSSTERVASLTCRKSGSSMSRPLQQHHPRAGADTADADDLAGHVDDAEPRQQPPTIIAQGSLVRLELILDDASCSSSSDIPQVSPFELTEWHHYRGLADDAVPAVHHLGVPGERVQAVAGVRLLECLRRLP